MYSGQIIATSHDLILRKRNHCISGKSRLVKYYIYICLPGVFFSRFFFSCLWDLPEWYEMSKVIVHFMKFEI